jgi:hypothetical protein
VAALCAWPGAACAAGQAITITAGKGATAVTGAEALQGGWTSVRLAVARGNRDSEVVLARLAPGVTLAALQRATRGTTRVPEDLVTIPTSNFLHPGASWRTTVLLAPGSYVALQLGRGPGIGPAAGFTVAPGATGRPPASRAAISLFDYGIRAPARLPPRGTLLIRNIGRNFHFLTGFRLRPGVDAGALVRSIRGGTAHGPPPGQQVDLIGLVSPGTANYTAVDLKPGTYVIACFFADRHSGGIEHSRFGMVRPIEVRS